MSAPSLSLSKRVIVKLAAVPFDMQASFEAVAASTIYNALEQLNGVIGHWMIRETSGLNNITLTVDNTVVYTVNAGGSLESEIVAAIRKLQTAVGAAGTYNLYIEGWSLALIRELEKVG